MDRFVYICDEKECELCASPLCNHTVHLEHAANFDHVPTEEEKEKYFTLLYTSEGISHYWEGKD